jgi:DNA-binding MarR family transcriptional regulator
VTTSPSAAAVDAARIIAKQCLAIRARRLDRTVTRIYDSALRPHGISAAQLGVLVAVALSGDAQPKTLCAILDLEKSTLSRNLALMVKNGWLTAERSGRAQVLRLAPAGAAALADALPAWRRAQRRVQRALSLDAVEMLRLLSGPTPQPERRRA